MDVPENVIVRGLGKNHDQAAIRSGKTAGCVGLYTINR
jgi:hypothetical protein